jgi:predicted site-specific integrase-resolvase
MQEIDTPAAAAAMLKVPEKTLTQWRYLGRGPAYSRVGKYVRYRRVDIEKWLEERSVTPGAV